MKPVPQLRAAGVLGSLAGSALLLSACGGPPAEYVTTKPSYLGDIKVTTYDGVSDDLLTAGLGKSGLGANVAPSVANPDAPTAAELRRLAIYNNYRAVLDPSADGGFGVLYGPNIDSNGKDTQTEGKIAGKEYIAYTDDGSGKQNVTLMVQIPSNFNSAAPCIVTATSSGSRGIYGAIGSAGEWGLKHGCAVAYNDKGSGNGVHDLQNNTVTLQDGTRANATQAGKTSTFTAVMTDDQRNAFNAATPNRVAVKHAHSQQNPERNWGAWTLQSIEFAYYLINDQYGKLASDGKSHVLTYSTKNTIVIASSISNGGGAALAAAEQDTQGLISGIAVSEPNVQLPPDQRLTVVRGNTSLNGSGRTLYDYATYANLLEPCAALDPNSPADAPFKSLINASSAAARCTALRNLGVINGSTTSELASNAQTALINAGYQPESRDLHGAMYATAIPAIVTTYGNALGRFSVLDNLCGYSFFANAAQLPLVFGNGNGVPPTSGISIYNNNSVGGPALDTDSITPSTRLKDYNIDGALCQRELASGSSANAQRVQTGINEIYRTANLRGKPALIVHGRSDTLIPVGFSSRPYFGMNKIVEGGNSRLSYIEVTNAQHFDSFLPQAGFSSRYIPLHVYFNQAMDMMYAALRTGSALPPSQVVRTTPRSVDAGGKVNPIASAMLPPIKLAPADGDAIVFNNNVVTIPD